MSSDINRVIQDTTVEVVIDTSDITSQTNLIDVTNTQEVIVSQPSTTTLSIDSSVNDVRVVTSGMGVQGLKGDSDYDIWLSLGNTGTKQDFINSLRGDAGSLVADLQFNDTTNTGTLLGVDFGEEVVDGVGYVTATVEASSLPFGTNNSFEDTVNNSTKLGVDFTDTSGVVTATVEASSLPFGTDNSFEDTVNNDTTLGVDFTDTDGVVRATVDASSIGGGSSNTFTDTAGAGGIDFTDTNGAVTAVRNFSWIEIVTGGPKTNKTTDTNGDKLYELLFQGEIYWRLFQTSPKANIIYKGDTFATAVEYTRRG